MPLLTAGDAGQARRLRATFDGSAPFAGLLAPDGTLLGADRASLEQSSSDADAARFEEKRGRHVLA